MDSKSSNSPAMAFILDYLKGNGDRPYGELKAAAEAQGYPIYPIMYGRAKALLGMIAEDGRVKRKRQRDEAAGLIPGMQHPAREGLHQRTLRMSRTTLSETSSAQLGVLLDRLKEVEADRARYRAALLQVERLLRQALELND